MSANIVFGRVAMARLLAGVSLAALAASPAVAADITWKGTNPASHQWSNTASWTGGIVPGAGDRAIFGAAGLATVLVQGPYTETMDLGSLWITNGAAVGAFNNESMRSLRLHGLGNPAGEVIGVLNEGTKVVTFFRNTIIANDMIIRAANEAGGGIRFSSGPIVGQPRGVELGDNTLTFDTVHAANLIDITSAIPFRGTGNLVKTGAGQLVMASISEYTGFTRIDGGGFRLTGAGSIASSSGLHNDGLFDISGVSGGIASIKALSGAGVVDLGIKTLRLTNASGTFAGTIQGSGGLSIDAGTATLSGANTYGGLTRVWSGATLRLGDGGSGGSVAGDIATDGTLVFNRSDDVVHAGGIEGAGRIDHVGSGTTTLTGNNVFFQGFTTVYAGTLAVNGLLDGVMEVRGGRLAGTGTVGWTHNYAGGTIAPGNSIGTLTVDGDYSSDGGMLEIEAILGDDSSSADLLLISGNALLGLAPTLVNVVNLGGLGAETTGDGIKIIEVAGGLSDAGAFVLGSPAIGGAYSYKLFQNDLATGLDGDWYLRADGLAPTTPTLENYPVALLGMIDLPTLRQRVGDRTEAIDSIWTRLEGGAGHYEADASSTDAEYDSSLFLAQVGLERPIFADAGGSLVAGLTAHYSSASADVTSPFGAGRNATESLGLGASLTWRGTAGSYADLQAQFAGFSSDLEAVGYSLVEDNAGAGFAVSLELGHEVKLDDNWSITPQAQLSYAAVSFDSFTDRFGSQITLESGDSLVGRLGLAVDYRADWQDAEGHEASSALYGIGNLTYEFLDGAAVVVSGTDLSYAGQKFGGELGLGGNIAWADGAQALHGELVAASSFEGSYAVKGTLGFSGKF